MRILLAAAEMAPVARVGGLAEAVGGLTKALRAAGAIVDVVLPDYGDVTFASETVVELAVPDWAGPASLRSGMHPEVGELHLVRAPGLARSNPYVDGGGEAWPDNDARFMAFSAAVAAFADALQPAVLHLNDWHTAAAPAFLKSNVPTLLTIHTLGYQGVTDATWLETIPRDSRAFEWYGGTNPLAAGIQLADEVSTVSPNYAIEILQPDQGMGLDELLAAREAPVTGIRNGIDTSEWDPSKDDLIAARYTSEDLSGRDVCRSGLLAEVGWDETREPVIGVVSRLVHQKGIDLLIEATRFLPDLPARLVVLGSGEPGISAEIREAATASPDRVWFFDGYDVGLAHRIFAGVDLLAMPSRFEPCGLAQMQAMAYGAIPIVTPVGGLVDSVVDADAYKRRGTGFVARGGDIGAVVDAIHRAVRAARNPRRHRSIQLHGMVQDWSWTLPAAEYLAIYEGLATS